MQFEIQQDRFTTCFKNCRKSVQKIFAQKIHLKWAKKFAKETCVTRYPYETFVTCKCSNGLRF